jgi:t-SNARE complex subunit (syntaxin)
MMDDKLQERRREFTPVFQSWRYEFMKVYGREPDRVDALIAGADKAKESFKEFTQKTEETTRQLENYKEQVRTLRQQLLEANVKVAAARGHHDANQSKRTRRS